MILKYAFENRNSYLLIVFLACQDSDSKKNNDVFALEKPSSKRLSIETLVKDLNHVVLEKSDFQHSKNQNIEL